MSPASYRTAPPRGDISNSRTTRPPSPAERPPTWAMPRSRAVHPRSRAWKVLLGLSRPASRTMSAASAAQLHAPPTTRTPAAYRPQPAPRRASSDPGCSRRSKAGGSALPAAVGSRRRAGPAELLVGLDRPVQRIGQAVLRVAVRGPVPLGHRLLGVGDRGVHVGQRLVEALLGGAVSRGGLLLALGGRLLALSGGLPASLLDGALAGLGVGRAAGGIGVGDLRIAGGGSRVAAEDQVERLVQRRREADPVAE